jgi:HK97 family phage prohead protease
LWGFREKIAPSAFDGALNDETKEVLAYWNHNTDLPLGRRSAATVEISKTKTLFKAAIVPNMDTEWGRSAVASIKRNDVKGMSFGFRVLPDGDQWDEDDDRNLIRTLLKVDLAEVSPTANPAYPNSSAKIRSEDDINEIRDALRFANKSITSETGKGGTGFRELMSANSLTQEVEDDSTRKALSGAFRGARTTGRT